MPLSRREFLYVPVGLASAYFLSKLHIAESSPHRQSETITAQTGPIVDLDGSDAISMCTNNKFAIAVTANGSIMMYDISSSNPHAIAVDSVGSFDRTNINTLTPGLGNEYYVTNAGWSGVGPNRRFRHVPRLTRYDVDPLSGTVHKYQREYDGKTRPEITNAIVIPLPNGHSIIVEIINLDWVDTIQTMFYHLDPELQEVASTGFTYTDKNSSQRVEYAHDKVLWFRANETVILDPALEDEHGMTIPTGLQTFGGRDMVYIPRTKQIVALTPGMTPDQTQLSGMQFETFDASGLLSGLPPQPITAKPQQFVGVDQDTRSFSLLYDAQGNPHVVALNTRNGISSIKVTADQEGGLNCSVVGLPEGVKIFDRNMIQLLHGGVCTVALTTPGRKIFVPNVSK